MRWLGHRLLSALLSHQHLHPPHCGPLPAGSRGLLQTGSWIYGRAPGSHSRMRCERQQHTTALALEKCRTGGNSTSALEDIRLLIKAAGEPLRNPSWILDERVAAIEMALARYVGCIRAIEAYDAAPQQHYARPSDGKAAIRVVRCLGALRSQIATAICECAEHDTALGRHGAGVTALAMAFDADRVHDAGFALLTMTMSMLDSRRLSVPSIVHVSTLVGRLPGAHVGRLPVCLLNSIFSILHRGRYYSDIELLGRRLTTHNINGNMLRIVLLSIRAQQQQQQQQQSSGRSTTLRQREWRRVPPHTLGRYEIQNPTCPDVKRARHFVRLLGSHDRRAVTEAHLTKLLEIEIAAIPRKLHLPGSMDLWLCHFYSYGIDPGVRTFTVLIDAFIAHDDSDFAWWIFKQMTDGQMTITCTDDGTSKVVSVPPPNDITIATISRAATRPGDLVASINDIERVYGRVSPRLITHAVARIIDTGDLATAESMWIDHGCSCSPRTAGIPARPLNYPALAKLILGYAESGNVEKAVAFLHTAVTSTTKEPTPTDTAYLVALFNTLLCRVLRVQNGNISGTKFQYDHYLLQLGMAHRIPFDTTTYNVLFASLSRAVLDLDVKAAPASIASLPLNDLAHTMHKLYLHMCVDKDIVPDDTTIVHLIPLWIYLDHQELASLHWRLLTDGKRNSKVDRCKRDVLALAKRWNAVAKVQAFFSTCYR